MKYPELSRVSARRSLTLAACLLAATAAQAAPVAVENASFEAPALGDGGFTQVAPPGWTVFGTQHGAGVFNPLSNQLATPSAGVQVGYVNPNGSVTADGIEQTLVDTLASGTHYTLQTDFAYRKDCCSTPDFALELLAGNTVLATFVGTSANFDNTSYKTATLTFDAAADNAHLGQALGIRLRSNTSQQGDTQFTFDNVRLDATISSVPLPAPALLFGSALGGLSLLRRRRS